VPRVHVIQIIPRRCRVGEVSFVAGELHALGVLVERSGLFSEGEVGVVGSLEAGGAGDEAGGAQVIEVEVALAGLGFGG
jgi:hypothetical protein